jgi:pyruvate-ferredoxin/flavodoxin oxidoreductase
MVSDELVAAHRRRGLSPDHPVLRGSAQNPDVFFQGREATNRFHDAVPDTVQAVFDDLAARTGRRYGLVEYVGAPDAERVVVLMGSGAGAAEEAVTGLQADGSRVGLVKVRLFRPFPAAAFVAALPRTVRSIAVLDRTKEPGATGEPLFEEVATAVAEAVGNEEVALDHGMPRIVGGRYGLGSKEFTPAMVAAVLDELRADAPRRRFTVGITDDVTGLSLDVDPTFRVDRSAYRAVFYGLGSDGTVGATKTAAKIVGDATERFVQAYFVYDSKKSGSITASHLRFGDEPIRSTYLVEQADLVACHQFGLLERVDVLARLKPGGTLLLNAPYPAGAVWDHLPAHVQQRVLAHSICVEAVDAHAVARQAGIPGRINAVMLPCFLSLIDLLPHDDMLRLVKAGLEKEYGFAGPEVVAANVAAVDAALAGLAPVGVGTVGGEGPRHRMIPVVDTASFVGSVTMPMIEAHGDELPVSALPVDGTYPTGTARFEKRAIATELPIWQPDLCIDCGKCTIVCPHAAIRMKVYEPDHADGAPGNFRSKPFRSKDLPDRLLTIQLAPDDCTGCGICVDVCPAVDKQDRTRKALVMRDALLVRDEERPGYDFFSTITPVPRDALPHDSVKGSQLLEPLFEFSGACAGCGETPYLKLLSQLFGDRMVVANATGCSSIYGGNLPTTPWTTNADGRGPAWSNSLFEDNAEFGLGLREGLDRHASAARRLLEELAPAIDDADLVREVLEADQSDEHGIIEQRDRVGRLRTRLREVGTAEARRLAELAENLVDRTVWIVGGDGWAYDIGFGGLDHVLASGTDVNVLVLDTETYSNTGGQASKSTPKGAVAKFAAEGKPSAKKDLGMIAMSYGNVYVAQIAIGANDTQTVKALLEAEAWPGPSLVIAYSTCIAHGIDMATSMSHQKVAVKAGYWPLYRFHPATKAGEHPFRLDSHDPSVPLEEFELGESRFAQLRRSDATRAAALLTDAQHDLDERWHHYRHLADQVREPDPNE